MTVDDIDTTSLEESSSGADLSSTVDVPEKDSFDDFYLSAEVLQSLDAIGYDTPTSCQREAIPLILAGIDLIVQSQTGTGKTAACAIPVVEMLDPNPGRVEVVVLAPTRELAKQVCREFEDIGEHKGLNATAIYGGTSYEKQYKALKTAQIVAATPGRLLDLLKKGKISFEHVRFFALDEADEMLSMGFREEVENIVDFLPEERQSLLFSATVNEAIKSLAGNILFYPEYISLSSDSVAAQTVRHEIFRVDGRRRVRDLVRILEYEAPENAIIFANTRQQTFELTEALGEYGYDARVLNGDLPQKEREKTLSALREGELDFLIATDVAARGIDISDLECVINYELPNDVEVYVHRTGRTGRIGKQGRALSLVAPAELPIYMQLRKLYDIEFHERELPTADELLTSQERKALKELPDRLDELDHLPWGAKLGMAEVLLETDDEDLGSDRKMLLARLLGLAETVLQRDDVRDALTALPDALRGDGGRTSEPQQTQRTPEADTPAESQTDEPQTQKTEEPAEESSSDDSGRKKSRGSSDDSSHKRRRRTSSDSADTPQKSEPESTTDSGDSSSDSGHRRRRRRGDDHQEAQQAQGQAASQQEQQQTSQDEPAPQQQQQDSGEVSADIGDVEMSKMYMDVGRDYFDDANELREMLCYMSGMSEEDFGDITVKSRYSFIEVREDFFYDVINALNNQDYEDTTLTAEPARS
jgi:ATP-dependent RNA helicase DeaD